MGQLIKLQDYVSRYEQNIYLYPSRYVRLKKQQWQKVLLAWENNETKEEVRPDWLEGEKQPFINKIKGMLKLGKKDIELQEDPHETSTAEEEDESLQFSPLFSSIPSSLEELKQNFLDQLFRFQMKWAGSTISEQSFVDKRFYFDERLKYFLQRFPDSYLVLYQPIFLLKKAPVEVETIVITPTEVCCIAFLEEEDSSVFIGSKEHFWIKRHQNTEKKVLNPLLALDRTENIIKNVFKRYGIELPIHKIILCRNGYIDYPTVPHDTKLVEKRNYDKWFQSMRSNRSPLKSIQLKSAQVLLQYCQTTSIRRIEWDVIKN